MYTRYKKLVTAKDAKINPAPIRISPRSSDLFIEYTDGLRLDMLAGRVYENSQYWWIILLANPEYQLETEIPFGDMIRVPYPLDSVLTELQAKGL